MPVQTVSNDVNKQMFIGLSTDAKPLEGLGAGATFQEIDGTFDTYIWNGPNTRGDISDWKLWASPVAIKGPGPGGRQEESITGLDYQAVGFEWKSQTLTTPGGTGDLTIWDGPALVRVVRTRRATDAGGALGNTAGIVLIKDGTIVKDAAAAAVTPSSVIYDGLDGIIFNTSFIVNLASAGDDARIEVLFKPLDPGVSWAG